jgi:hypothetical protein
MSKQYRIREGVATALNTKTQLTTAGSDTAPGPLMVPQGMKYIVGLIVSAVGNMAAATGYAGLIRVEGAGLVNGPESFAACSGGQFSATGGNAAPKAVEIPCNLAVSSGNEVQRHAKCRSCSTQNAYPFDRSYSQQHTYSADRPRFSFNAVIGCAGRSYQNRQDCCSLCRRRIKSR